MKTATAPRQIPTCRVLIVNEVLGTHSETLSPQSPDEAMKNHGAVALARKWLDHNWCKNLDVEILLDPQPIAVAVHKKADEILVHWHVIGDDPEAARDAIQKFLSGKGEEGLLL